MTRMCSSSRGIPTSPGRVEAGSFVRADRLAPRPIVDALERGDFYASTGVELADYQVTDKAITITDQDRQLQQKCACSSSGGTA